MATIQEHWQRIPLWGKFLIVGGAAYGVYRLTSNDKSGGTSDHLVGPNDGLSYQPYEYQVAADSLENYFLTGFMGMTENDTAIGQILMSMNTNADVIALNNAFGTRYTWDLWIVSGSGGNLTWWINKFLDNDVKQAVKANYQSKGINYIW